MAGNDDFHKRLERIQQSHQHGKTVSRQMPTGVRGKKIGLVREKEEEAPKKKGSVFAKILVLGVVGLFGVRVALATMTGMSPQALDARQAELFAENTSGGTAGGIALTVLGVADPFLTPVFDRLGIEDVDPSAVATAEEEIVEPDLFAAPRNELAILGAGFNAEIQEPRAGVAGLIEATEGLSDGSNTSVDSVLPARPPRGWTVLRASDVLFGGGGYFDVKSSWQATNPTVSWNEIPYLGSFLKLVSDNETALTNQTRFAYLFFNEEGQSVLIEYIRTAENTFAPELVFAGGDEIFIGTAEAGFRFSSDGVFQPNSHRVFTTALNDRVLMGTAIANGNLVDLQEFLNAFNISQIADAADELAVEPVQVAAPTAAVDSEPAENEYSLWAIARRIFDMRSDRPVVPIEQLVPARIDGWYQMTDADLAIESQDLASIVTGNGGVLPSSTAEVPLYDFFIGLSGASSEMSGMVQLPVTLFFNDQGQAFITTVFVVTTGLLTAEDFAAAMAEQNAEFAQTAQSQVLVSTASGQTYGFYSDDAFQVGETGIFRGMVGPHFTYVFYSEGMSISDLESALSGFPFDEVALKRF